MIEYTKIYHLSHTDLDGYGSQYMTRHLAAINEHLTVKYFNASYKEVIGKVSEILSEIANDREGKILVLITDLSINEKIAKKLNNFKRGNKDIDLEYLALDHHRSNPEVAKQNKWCYVDHNKCGASITADFISGLVKSESVKSHLLFVGKFIQAHDIWEKESEYFHKSNLLADIINNFYFPDNMSDIKREFILNYIFVFLNLIKDLKGVQEIEMSLPIILKDALFLSGLNKDISESNIPSKHKLYYFLAKKYAEKEQKLYSYLRDHDKTYEFEEYFFRVVFNMNSECFQYFSHYYLEDNKNIDFIISISSSGKCALRSVKDVDVNKIAYNIAGGGGHFNASGMKFNFTKNIHSDVEAIMNISENVKDIKITKLF